MKKRILAVILSFVMIVTLVPAVFSLSGSAAVTSTDFSQWVRWNSTNGYGSTGWQSDGSGSLTSNVPDDWICTPFTGLDLALNQPWQVSMDFSVSTAYNPQPAYFSVGYYSRSGVLLKYNLDFFPNKDDNTRMDWYVQKGDDPAPWTGILPCSNVGEVTAALTYCIHP